MQTLFRFQLVLIYLGFTLLLPLLLPFSTLFQLLMSQLVSVVWAELHTTAYMMMQMLFAYSTSAVITIVFMIKMRINKRLQPHYTSPRLWLVGCILILVVFIVNVLTALSKVNLQPFDANLLAGMLTVAKITLLVAAVRVLIGVLPRANKKTAR
jgi:hypothetical protein